MCVPALFSTGAINRSLIASVDSSVLDGMTDNRMRVKLYSFNDSLQWEDKGTGHLSTIVVGRYQSPAFLVRSEEDGESCAPPTSHALTLGCVCRVCFVGV